MKERRFDVGGLNYIALLNSAGDFSFSLIGGNTKKGSSQPRKEARNDLWYDEREVWGDVDLAVSALPVLSKAAEILIEWVYSEKLWRFGFSSATARKTPIYRWLALRLSKRLPTYELTEWPEGCFNWYRHGGKNTA